jgi:DNA excision repair protein ERCC-5
MGVNGLWTVVQPCARPTNLATLNRKRLAVDASIWIYQFLKAVRDKEGNALRNSHVVGFFRRICKLLWFGIKPVFVFDGGAPALKRQTIQNRKRRREGRRDDAVRTAGKLLAVQMQRAAEEDEEKRKREAAGAATMRETEEEEPLPSADQLVYVGEEGMSQQERQKTRKFTKKDQYHLPALDGDISSMARADDPRIMSIEELEEYARQFNDGEDINLYDFSKIDFDGDFFKSLPAADRYNILNAARLRSRLRMGLSKEQLEHMFPNRMDFSRFQVERVQERNKLTQRLMKEAGMTGLDLTISGGGRIAGERGREYILVKNEGAEGGWALGVVSKEKDIGEAHKPIDVDELDFRYQQRDEKIESGDEDEEFEDVPVEGLNRLPKPTQQIEDESLFVGGDTTGERLHPEEEDDINQAIALSLRAQHGNGTTSEAEEEVEFEDVEMPAPEWEQKAVPASKPIVTTSGRMVAHIVNNRANAAVPRRRANQSDSDSEDDLKAALAASRKRKQKQVQPKPVVSNVKNAFDGPLPFPKLDLGFSPFAKITPRGAPKAQGVEQEDQRNAVVEEDMLSGGFERDPTADGAKPLPPWMVDDTDIRETIARQNELQAEVNAEDRAVAEEEERLFRRRRQDEVIAIESSDDESDVEILEGPPALQASIAVEDTAPVDKVVAPESNVSEAAKAPEPEPEMEMEFEEVAIPGQEVVSDETTANDAVSDDEDVEITVTELPDSPEPVMEDVIVEAPAPVAVASPPKPIDDFADEDLPLPAPAPAALATEDPPGDDIFGDSDVDEYSDPEDEELFASLAQEADEHARFASELNNKSEQENRLAYEKELQALRTQQKKDRRDADEVSQVMVGECQALLRLFGIPYITAPMEAEAQCAELVRLGLVDGIVTDDSDTFLFGGTRVYKNMFNSNKLVECYLASDLDKELSLDREQLISLALLLGSDYTDGLPGVGPVTAVEILSEFPAADGGLSAFRDWWFDVQGQRRTKAEDAANPFRRKFRKSQATKLFLPAGFPTTQVREAYMKPEVDDSPEAFQWGVPDLEGLRQFLMATIGWSKERTDEVLVPVIRDMNRRDVEGTQSNITRYFEGGVGVGANTEGFAPRQKAKASKRMSNAVSKLRANAGGVNAVTAGMASAAERAAETAAQVAANDRRRKRKTRPLLADDGDEAENGKQDGDAGNDTTPAEAQRGPKRRAKGPTA